MTPMQQILLGVGAKKKTYIEDVFSTYLWAGSGSARAINNGINLSSKGGMVWIKNRTYGTNKHVINDTVRGHSNAIMANTTDANTTQAGLLDGFNSNGFDVSTDNFVNGSSQNYASWTWRRAEGFFDVVTYTGNGSNRTIAHSLGSVPGMIMVKRLDAADNWIVYHRGNADSNNAAHYNVRLDSTNAKQDSSSRFNDTEPTASVFSVGTDGGVNDNNGSYVAYLFAGGESTAATASSTKFTGSVYLSIPSSGAGDLSPGTGDFCLEAWIKPDDWQNTDGFYWVDGNGPAFQYSSSDNKLNFKTGGTNNTILLSAKAPSLNEWTHVAVTRSGSALKMFFNGTEVASATNSDNITGVGTTYIGYGLMGFEGDISNLRFVKGSAVYTTSFRPPTEPLTNISGTELLMCNSSSSATGSTVTPGTISSSGGVNPSANSPFDDPAAFTFGENEDQGIIKCGSYVGNGGTQDVYLGFEPQWFVVKKASDTSAWHMVDCMRGCVTGGADSWFEFNTADAESTAHNFFKVTPTGFSFEATAGSLNGNGGDFIYIAIRRPDGYCGKPAEAGTEVFSPAVSGGSSSAGGLGCFVPNFPVDFGIIRTSGSSHPWQTGARLMGVNYFPGINDYQATTTASNFSWDSNVGYITGNFTGYHSWVWKRHKGFTVCTYKGDGVAGRKIAHDMNKSVGMMMVKNRSTGYSWKVFHTGLNGGTNPEDYYLETDDGAEANDNTIWNDTAPTSTHITVGNGDPVNKDGDEFLAILFSSVEGISKCGSYVGQTGNDLTIELGFTPRFFLCTRIDAHNHPWYVFDTVRGIASGNDQVLKLDSNAAQFSGDYVDTTSSGITLAADYDTSLLGQNSSAKHIYYAHA